MARQRHRTPLDYEAEDKQDIRRQEFIFLSTFFLMVLLMVSLYFQLSLLAIGAVVVALLASTVGFCIHYRTFFSMRDRGQRTESVLISLYGSLILTLICAYYYTQDQPLSLDFSLVSFSSPSWSTAVLPVILSSAINGSVSKTKKTATRPFLRCRFFL